LTPNPWHDATTFLSTPNIATGMIWLLFAGSGVIALAALRTDPSLRTTRHVGIWLLRLIVGAMWWQQSLWKIPPNYDGLLYWMKQMVDHASIPLQSRFVQEIVLPNIALFGPLVYAI
jgi:hypothetical protein